LFWILLWSFPTFLFVAGTALLIFPHLPLFLTLPLPIVALPASTSWYSFHLSIRYDDSRMRNIWKQKNEDSVGISEVSYLGFHPLFLSYFIFLKALFFPGQYWCIRSYRYCFPLKLAA